MTDADLIEHLAEIDRRRLHPNNFHVSLFEYCVHRLKMSEGSAYRRIRAARAFKLFPPLMNMLRDGKLSPEALALLHPYMSDPDAAMLALKAVGMSIRNLEALLAARKPGTNQRDCIRFVGAAAKSPAPSISDTVESLFHPAAAIEVTASPTVVPSAPASPSVPEAEHPTRAVRFAFTADEHFYKMLEQARALLRHKYPDGRLEGVLRDALRALIERRDPVLRWRASQRRKKS